MPAGDNGVGVPVSRVVFVGWGISVGSVVLDGRDVLAEFGELGDILTVTAVLVDSAVTISSSTATDLPTLLMDAVSTPEKNWGNVFQLSVRFAPEQG